MRLCPHSAAFLVAGLLLVAGRAPAAEQKLTISDTIGRAWTNEPIAWELPGVHAESVLVKRDGQPIPAQVVAGEGSVSVLFIVDSLAKDASTVVTAEPGAKGPAESDLTIREEGKALVLASRYAAVRVNNGDTTNLSPILGVRTTSGVWLDGGAYDATTAKPVRTQTEVLERGPVRLRARVTTTFDNERRHVVTFSLWSNSHSIDIDEDFNVGPDDKYAFKQYKNDRDELAWEWWSWYGDREGVEESHPNNWIVRLDGAGFAPRDIQYYGCNATDSSRGDTQNRGRSGYTLAHDKDRRFEKYLVGHSQWRPDAVLWYATSAGTNDDADAVAVYTHSVRTWRNPNVLPAPTGITLRTGVNDMRIVSRGSGGKLEVECPIGLGHRAWAIRVSTRKESLSPAGASPTALDAERVQRSLGLDIARRWITDWDMRNEYPRLFIKPGERESYYARLKGNGIGSSGNIMDTFLRNQDQASFDKDYAAIDKQADEMIQGYIAHGMDNTVDYPGWMLGYWHGIVVAGGVDNLCGTPFCTPERAKSLKKKLAIITYALVSPDAWPDKQINYGWGSMNMPVGRWGGRVVMACALSDHPLAKEWLKDAGRYFKMLLETEYSADGVGVSCPHYIGASSTSFFAWIAMANSGLAEDMSQSPVLRKFARYYMQLMKPIDPRWGIRVLLNEGDTRPGSSPMPAILARFLKHTDPELASQLMQLWIEGGSDLSLGMGIADALLIDPSIPPKPLSIAPIVYPGFGAFLRYRQAGTPEEAYLAFVGGNFMIDHANADQLGFSWHEKGVPLTDFEGALYQPMAGSAVSHNTIAWDVRAGGAADPGKDQPGNWYHDHKQPYVDLGDKTPRLHVEIGWDKASQDITETRGMVTLAADAPGAALLEGRVTVKAMTETPTRQDNYAIAVAVQAAPPTTPLAAPFTWTRRLLYVKAPEAAGMNYVVVRDDFGGFDQRTPSFNGWWFAEDVELGDHHARYTGQFGVDTELFVAWPPRVTLHKDVFIHDQCEPIVAARHREKFGKPFSEKQVLCRVEGEKDKGFLVALFPYKPDEPRPLMDNWCGERGVKVTWKDETHFVLLDTVDRDIDADGVRAHASCVVVKAKDANNFTISLPAGGSAAYGGKEVKSDGPAEWVVTDGKADKTKGIDIMARSR